MKENIVRRIPAQPTKEFNGVLKFPIRIGPAREL